MQNHIRSDSMIALIITKGSRQTIAPHALCWFIYRVNSIICQSNGSAMVVVDSATLPLFVCLRVTFLLTVLETALPRCNAVLESLCENADVARMIS